MAVDVDEAGHHHPGPAVDDAVGVSGVVLADERDAVCVEGDVHLPQIHVPGAIPGDDPFRISYQRILRLGLHLFPRFGQKIGRHRGAIWCETRPRGSRCGTAASIRR